MKTWNEFEIEKPKDIIDGYALLIFTDLFLIAEYPFDETKEKLLKENFHKLLDCRIFDKHCEYRIMRGDIGRNFASRFVKDDDPDCRDYYDDEQFLDIDEKRSEKLFQSEHKVRATGGGKYELPFDSFQGAKAVIRNYVSYDDSNGQAYIRDWRLAGFKTKEN